MYGAACGGHLKVMVFLLDKGANPNLADKVRILRLQGDCCILSEAGSHRCCKLQ